MEDLRQAFKTIYKSVMILVTAALVVGAGAAFWYGDEANGLWLVGGIAAILALIAGLSIDKLDRQDEQAEALRSIVDDIRSKVRVTHDHVEPTFKVSQSFAEPEVHRVDMALLAEAREMDRRGEPIDDICRRIDPAFDGHDEMHQAAFRRMVRAMLDEG